MMLVAQGMDLPDDPILELGRAGLVQDAGQSILKDAGLKETVVFGAEKKLLIRTRPHGDQDLFKSADGSLSSSRVFVSGILGL